MKMEAEIGVMLSQTKECLEPPETGRGRKDSPTESLEQTGLADTLISDFCPPEL